VDKSTLSTMPQKDNSYNSYKGVKYSGYCLLILMFWNYALDNLCYQISTY